MKMTTDTARTIYEAMGIYNYNLFIRSNKKNSFGRGCKRNGKNDSSYLFDKNTGGN